MIIDVYVIREQEDTVNDCKTSCISCIDNLVHEAAILQFGSLEELGGSDEGNHGDCFTKKHCQNIKTCGQSGDFIEGISKVYYDTDCGLHVEMV